MTRHEQYIAYLCTKWSMPKTGIYKHMRNLVSQKSDECVDWMPSGGKPLPDLWKYCAPSLENPFHKYEWHEVVDSNDVSKEKLYWLYWLKDWVDGVQLHDKRWLDIVFYKHDLINRSCNEFDPYEMNYEWLKAC